MKRRVSIKETLPLREKDPIKKQFTMKHSIDIERDSTWLDPSTPKKVNPQEAVWLASTGAQHHNPRFIKDKSHFKRILGFLFTKKNKNLVSVAKSTPTQVVHIRYV